ncbi:MAG TPA: baseplate J/gp47 family protein [Candidatus Sumerlaeota bacterium]|nr:baseplate J/gp47 family protein [Candidatus Sumerlaeota bacterium]
MSIQDLVSRSLDEIRQNLFDRLTSKQEEYAATGWLPIRLNLNKGIVRGLIELWAWGLWQLYQFLGEILKQAFPDTATGKWLELHCRQVGVSRKAWTKTQGVVYFIRLAAGGNVAIPAGRVVKTKPDGAGNVYRYVTTAAVVLAAGTLEVAVPVEAEEFGAASNATAGQISEIATVIPGVDGVENRADWLTVEGTDEELDEPLRLRYQLAWQSLNGCTKHAYQAWALEVTGVVDVKILDQHPRGQGTLDVLIVGSAGVPTQQLIDAVAANILGTGNDDEKNPINDDVEVRGPTPINIDYAAELELISGDEAAIVAEAENRVRALFAAGPVLAGISRLGVGQDVTQDRLNWAVMLPTVKKINTDFADVAVPEDGLAALHSINITATWAAEE